MGRSLGRRGVWGACLCVWGGWGWGGKGGRQRGVRLMQALRGSLQARCGDPELPGLPAPPPRGSPHLCRYSRPSRICLVYTLTTDSLKLPNLANSEAMEPPGTYSRKMLSDSSVFSVPCENAHGVRLTSQGQQLGVEKQMQAAANWGGEQSRMGAAPQGRAQCKQSAAVSKAERLAGMRPVNLLS